MNVGIGKLSRAEPVEACSIGMHFDKLNVTHNLNLNLSLNLNLNLNLSLNLNLNLSLNLDLQR